AYTRGELIGSAGRQASGGAASVFGGAQAPPADLAETAQDEEPSAPPADLAETAQDEEPSAPPADLAETAQDEEPSVDFSVQPAEDDAEKRAKLKDFMQQLDGASALFREGMRDGAFTPWIRDRRLLDLHSMNLEVAKVAVYNALKGVPDLPEGDKAFQWGLKVIAGRGLRSEDGPVLGPKVRRMIDEDFGLIVTDYDEEEGFFRIPGKEIERIHAEGVWPPQWLLDGCPNPLRTTRAAREAMRDENMGKRKGRPGVDRTGARAPRD
ncbi:unnamed protein product, partial [Polarella glacialis]